MTTILTPTAPLETDPPAQERPAVVTISLNRRPREYCSWFSATWDAMTVLTNPQAPKANVRACKEMLIDMAQKLDGLRSMEAGQ